MSAQSALSANAQFTTTHWSEVLAAGESSGPGAAQGLDSLCRSYWQPLYVFVRRAGYSPEDARDLTQSFFAFLLERKAFKAADPHRGRFRSFLIGSLKHFLANEQQRVNALKRGGGRAVVSLDELEPEERDLLEPSETDTPEAIYERRWARLQVEKALDRLRADYVQAGRGALFELLKAYVWGEKNGLNLAEIAEQLDLTEEAVKKSVQRLRLRFREALRTEVAQTVAVPDQIDEELRHLRGALSSGH